MLKKRSSRREKVRIPFKIRKPKIYYRLTHQIQSRDVDLIDISETGFCFKANESDLQTQVGDLIFVDFAQINEGHSTEFTARINRVFETKEDGLIFGAEFVSVARSFVLKISSWAATFLKTGIFLVERRSPSSITNRALQKPFELLSIAIDELKWQLDHYKDQCLNVKTQNEIATQNLTESIDFDQV